MLLVMGGAWAQTVSSVIVSTNPSGGTFEVDGYLYNAPQSFLWPAGSKHILNFPYSLDNNGNSLGYQSALGDQLRYTFTGWNAGTVPLSGGGLMVTITADPSVATYTAELSATMKVTLSFPQASPTATCAAGSGPGDAAQTSAFQDGVAIFDGSCYASSASFYLGAGTINLLEYPYPGWVFYGWNINNGIITTPITSYNLQSPSSFQPLFSIAKRVHFMTTPPGLNVVVDSETTPTPTVPNNDGAYCNQGTSNTLSGLAPPGFPVLCTGDYDFLPGSSHRVGAATPQMDINNNYWIFEGFTNGQGQNSVYIADQQTNISTTLTAQFVPGVKVALISSQPGLKFIVDGQTNLQSYTFVWGAGETHTIGAPTTQVDSSGRTWVFVKWSNGGAQTQTLTVPSGVTAIPLTATFALEPLVTINTVPQGVQVTVNGAACTTPCSYSQASGTTLQVTAPATLSTGAGSRVSFTGWGDGNTSTTRTITFTGNAQAFQANYQTQWLLSAVASPVSSAYFTYSPATPDGYFNDGTQITVTVNPANGYKFVKWGGDLTGTYTTGYLTMSSPHSIVAFTLTVPYIAPAGIVSAAGATPDGTVAPGSVITIYGNNLAPALQVGSTNPLPQSLGNITVTVGNYLLPLLFVSPTQINAQLPVELVDGSYTLLVHQTGQPDVSGSLTVSRDAPAMFTQANSQNVPLVLALHQDGTLVTFDAPAIRGEQISIYGTGFGPYVTTTVDGFFAPAAPSNAVADPVTLTVGNVTKTPDFAGAAPGTVGLTLIQMTITNDLPTATSVNMQVQVNSKLSTAVVLPLQ